MSKGYRRVFRGVANFVLNSLLQKIVQSKLLRPKLVNDEYITDVRKFAAFIKFVFQVFK